MGSVQPLLPAALFTPCDPTQFTFTSTDDLTDRVGFLGQDRAVKAIELGVAMKRHGYNIYTLGPTGTGKYTLARQLVEERAGQEPAPSDWCYVYDFANPNRPRALRLPAGKGRELRRDFERLVEDLQNALPAAFESEEYQTRRRGIEEESQEQQQESLKELQERARERNLALLRTPAGLAFAPLRDGNVLPPEEFQKLAEEEQRRIQEEVEELQEQLQKVLYQVPRWERELRSRVRALNQEVASYVLEDLFDDLHNKYAELPAVLAQIQAMKQDVREHLQDFLGSDAEQQAEKAAGSPAPDAFKQPPALRRYLVNLMVDSGDAQGAPVVYESNPTYLNLVGRIEQMAMMGALVTDFTLIKPGVLHRVNGGYLILDALKVLTSPYAWEGLKRALEFGEIRIESPLQMLSLTSTVSLEPEPIPLDVKVILMGDRMLYYMLSQLDPDFSELFKIAADFDDEFERDGGNQLLYAQIIADIVHREGLLPFDRQAVCRVIEHSARLANDAERLTARMQSVVDLLEEADHWARQGGAGHATVGHVQQAIDAQVYRSDRVRERMQEETLRETILIDTAGETVGQINALSVIQLGNFAFGRPSRITASVRMGRGEVVDIEREVEMGGPLHSKGVLILASFLRARYAAERPLSLGASLVFEQSYGGVDGDSASSTELYALLSAIAGAPVRQSLAVTGSVNQRGQVQAIGGVNEKIEGFFDLCQARGLTGEQGVLIPAANVKHLMLRRDVVEAAAAGRFHIYPVETVDQGIELLTGVPAGVRGDAGAYPEGTINRLVEDRLAQLSEKRKEYDQPSESKQDEPRNNG